jgi:integrase
MARYQNGWLQKKPRKSGDIWVFCYRRQRAEDGAWVQATPIKVGKVKNYPSEEAAWRRVEELHLNPNQSPFEVGAKPLFGELAAHYIQRELPEDQTQATIEKAYSTIRKYKRYLSRWALPRWGTTPALAVHPPDVEDWLRELKKKFELRNPTLGEIRKAMNNVYVHGQRQGFLPRTTDGNPIGFVRQSLASDFEPVILTLPQVLDIFDNLDLMRRTMALTDAATALRVSEVLALKWNDLDFIDHLIQVRRAYVDRRFGPPKSKASKAPVPMHPLLAAHLLAWRRETLYPGNEDFVFPSLRLKLEGEETACSEHVGRGLSESSGAKGRSRRATACLRFSHLPKNAGLGVGEDESRYQDGAGDSAAPKLENDSRDLCQVDVRRQAAGPGNVS